MMLAKAKLASSITFIVLASFTIVTNNRQNMFIIQATGRVSSTADLVGNFCSGYALIADIFACLLDLNFMQSKLTRLNF